MRKYDHGFDIAKIKQAIEKEDWEPDGEEAGYAETRRVFLGTIIAITPSGKFYVPFACSNVAGDCPVCKGAERAPEPRTGRRARKRAERRMRDRSRRQVLLMKGYADMSSPKWWVGSPTSRRTDIARDRRIIERLCHTCGGMGSISAFRDLLWQEALVRDLARENLYLDCDGDAYFAVQVRDIGGQVECADCGADIQHDATRDVQRCDSCEEKADGDAAPQDIDEREYRARRDLIRGHP